MIDFDGTLNAAIGSTLGDQLPVTYTAPGGSPVTVLGIFTLITERVFGDDGTPDANITVATLGLQLSQLPAPPVQSGIVLVDGVSYVIKDADFDGLGWAYLDLGAQ